jgi:hypothetical protein
MDEIFSTRLWGILTVLALTGVVPSQSRCDEPINRSPDATLPAVVSSGTERDVAADQQLALPAPNQTAMADPAATFPLGPAGQDGSGANLTSEQAFPMMMESPPEQQLFGYKEGFFLRTADGKYKINVNGGIQMRYNATWRNADSGVDGFEGGFVVQHVPLVFTGNFLSPDLTYLILLDSMQNLGYDYTAEVKMSYAFNERWMIGGGHFRDPAFMRELDPNWTRQLCAERSYINAIFGMGLSEGVIVTRQTDLTRLNFFVNDGKDSGNPGGSMDYEADFTDIAISTSLDIKLFGDWAQYTDFTSWPNDDWAMFLRGGLHWEDGESGDNIARNNKNNWVAWCSEVTLEGHGFNILASGTGRHSLNRDENLNQYGFMMQSGYQIVPEKWEPFARYEYIDFNHMTGIGGTPIPNSNLNLITFGVNRYFARHSAKITTEVIHACNPVPINMTKSGLLEDPLGGEFTLRTQVQLLF